MLHIQVVDTEIVYNYLEQIKSRVYTRNIKSNPTSLKYSIHYLGLIVKKKKLVFFLINLQ